MCAYGVRTEWHLGGEGLIRIVRASWTEVADHCCLLRAVGQGVEAFGYQRIIYGSAPTTGPVDSGDWYALARESLSELGLEQEAVDGIFATNAQGVYAV